MKLALINCSIHHQKTDRTVAFLAGALAAETDLSLQVVTIDEFRELFHGEFITLDTATPAQRLTLAALRDADVLVFVCPTYYKTMPGAIKNFFDIVRDGRLYAGKLALIVSSNHKNQDFGARDLALCLDAMAEFYDVPLVRVGEIPIIDPNSIDAGDVDRIMTLLRRYDAAVFGG